MTRSEIVQDLLNLIGPGPEITGQGLINWINEAYLYMIDEIQKVNPNYFNKKQTTDLIANQTEYALPSDADEVTMVNVNYGDGWRRALPLQDGINQVPVFNDTTSSQGFISSDPKYYVRDRKLGILPAPATSYTGGIELWHVYDPNPMTADSDEPELPVKYHYLIKQGAYSNHLHEDDQHGAADNAWTRFEKRVADMVESLTSDQTDEPKSILITGGTDLYDMQPDWYN